ncbi:MAG: methylenetetrahydrofolate--tRNA-(uracil(54)-C(5))-methyltransferase (FADH(2)-oxidizing) TrmFO [Coriobacteriia bacterium]|nr:methylenetetrahydrofolate--tRNA-(uracil(54)-C(5))-methyltransferase (FADH(2)-oxidizing) TrmFO [Coriobacteriia bacterium]
MRDYSLYDVVVVGAGLSGSEAALQCAASGLSVALFEMRPSMSSPAHHGDGAAELVCSNSFKSDDPTTAAGLLKRELALMGSRLLEVAYRFRVPAGSALAIDRERFSEEITELLNREDRIDFIREEFTDLQKAAEQTPVIVAAGPLVSEALAKSLGSYTGASLFFYDAAAPIVSAESLDGSRVFAASRYGKGAGDDYLNIALDRDEYDVFYHELISARRVHDKVFEQSDFFNACQPVEEIARKGYDALRYGALKPVGIDDPRTGRWPFALVQLRCETVAKQAYNLVGFQTNLTWPEQKRVFSLLPGMGDARFERYGVMHRNTFVDAPRVQNIDLSLKAEKNIFLAGQIAGTEGYTEAIASGQLCALNVIRRIQGKKSVVLPSVTVLGSLMEYAHSSDTIDYQPMHVNFGIMQPLVEKEKGKRARYKKYALRSMEELYKYLSTLGETFDFASLTSRYNALKEEIESVPDEIRKRKDRVQ